MVMSTKKIVRGIDKSLNKAVSEINASTPKPDMKDDGAELKAAVAPKKAQTFSEAFREARAKAVKEGRDPSKEIFTWGGEKKVARLAGEGAKRPATTRSSGSSTTTNTSANATSNQSNTPSVGSRQKPFKVDTKEDIQVTAKPRTSKDRSAEARTRFGKVVESVNPFRAIAKGIDYALTPSSRTANRTPERPALTKPQRLAKLKREAEAPGANRFA